MNSSGQALLIDLKWVPLNKKATTVCVRLVLDDGNENYELIESTLSSLKSNKYRVGGLNVEIISPLRLIRLQFRGYLKNLKTGEACFVKFRLLWQTTSEVFDFRYDFDDTFMANELTQNDPSKAVDFENRFAQFGQIKGTIQIEKETEKEIYLWGSRQKHWLMQDGDLISKTLYGYSKV